MVYKKRHAKQDEERRTLRKTNRHTETEWSKIMAAAHALKMSVSDWMIHKADRQKKT